MKSEEFRTAVKVAVRALTAVAILLIIVTSAVRSETLETAVARDSSGEYNVIIRADNAPVAGVISKLSESVGFKVHGKLTRPVAKISGTYKGSLPKVLSRLLSGNNYILVSERSVPKSLLILPRDYTLAKVGRAPPSTPKISKLRRKYSTILARSKKLRRTSERMRSRMPKYADKLVQIADHLDAEARAIRAQLPQ